MTLKLCMCWYWQLSDLCRSIYNTGTAPYKEAISKPNSHLCSCCTEQHGSCLYSAEISCPDSAVGLVIMLRSGQQKYFRSIPSMCVGPCLLQIVQTDCGFHPAPRSWSAGKSLPGGNATEATIRPLFSIQCQSWWWVELHLGSPIHLSQRA